MNTGSEAASHKLLMYIHADSRVPRHFDTRAWHALMKPGVVAGAFRFGVDAVHVEKKRWVWSVSVGVVSERGWVE